MSKLPDYYREENEAKARWFAENFCCTTFAVVPDYAMTQMPPITYAEVEAKVKEMIEKYGPKVQP